MTIRKLFEDKVPFTAILDSKEVIHDNKERSKNSTLSAVIPTLRIDYH